MSQVAASEFDLLTLARALVGQTDPYVVQPLLRQARRLPRQIGPAAARLLEQTLSTGVVLAVARRGGWRRERYLVDGVPRAGRTWERHGAPVISFSAFSMRLLRWLTREPVESAAIGSLSATGALHTGDELLLYLAADLLHQTRLSVGLARQSVFRNSGLCWLFFADQLVDSPPLCEVSSELFTPWLSAGRALFLEAFQPALAARWVQMEEDKGTCTSNERMIVTGSMQHRVLSAFLAEADRQQRRDLASFLLHAAADLLRGDNNPERWAGSLSRDASLRDRSGARRAAGAFLRSLDTWHEWTEQHRNARFFDDDYDAAQLLLLRWEWLGDEGLARARDVVRSLESMQAVAG